jgi:hypothetical protein
MENAFENTWTSVSLSQGSYYHKRTHEFCHGMTGVVATRCRPPFNRLHLNHGNVSDASKKVHGQIARISSRGLVFRRASATVKCTAPCITIINEIGLCCHTERGLLPTVSKSHQLDGKLQPEPDKLNGRTEGTAVCGFQDMLTGRTFSF